MSPHWKQAASRESSQGVTILDIQVWQSPFILSHIHSKTICTPKLDDFCTRDGILLCNFVSLGSKLHRYLCLIEAEVLRSGNSCFGGRREVFTSLSSPLDLSVDALQDLQIMAPSDLCPTRCLSVWKVALRTCLQSPLACLQQKVACGWAM